MNSAFTYFYFLCITFFLLPIISFAQYDSEEIKSKLPQLLSTSNVGNKFMLTLPPPAYHSEEYGNFIGLYAISHSATTITVSNQNGFTKSVSANALELIQIKLNMKDILPFSFNMYQAVPTAKIYKGAGLTVESDSPIVLYFMVDIKESSDAFLAIPEKSLGKEYIAATIPKLDPAFSSITNLPPWITVVGVEDTTNVTLTLGGLDRNSNTLQIEMGPKISIGESYSFILNRSDVFMAATSSFPSDLTGTKIIADKAVAFITGHSCNRIPLYTEACDYSVEMPFPTSTWALEYLIPSIPHRKKSGLFTILAKDSNTTVYRDGEFLFKIEIPGGGSNKQKAYYHSRIWTDTNYSKPAFISADKPISIMYFNPSTNDDKVRTDPFWMNIVPTKQFSNYLLTCVPNNFLTDSLGNIDSTYCFLNNYVNLVFECDENGNIPDDLQWMNLKIKPYTWIPAKEIFTNPISYFWKDPSNPKSKQYANTVAYLSMQDLYAIRSLSGKSNFATYSYGDHNVDSYGFPTAANFTNFNANSHIKTLSNFNIACINSQQLIAINVANSSNNDFFVENLRIESDEDYVNWEFTGTKDYPRFKLEALKDTTLYILFNPQKVVPSQVIEVTLLTDELELYKSSTTFDITANEFPINNDAKLSQSIIKYGNSSTDTVFFNVENIDISELYIEELELQVSFPDDYIKADLKSIRLLGDFAENCEIVNLTTLQPQRISPNNVQLTLKIRALNNLIINNFSSELLAIDFNAYLPSEGRSLTEENRNIKISHKVSIKSSCLYTQTFNNELEIKSICADNLRHLSIGEGYYLQRVNPILTNNQNINLEYSIGFDEYATLRIIDLSGNVVSEPVNSFHSAGKHQIEFPTIELNSGLYFYQLRSANYIQTYQVMIVK